LGLNAIGKICGRDGVVLSRSQPQDGAMINEEPD
jgi:hypothetical protein